MIRKEIRSADYPFSFVAYMPENMEGPLPLVVQLHGAGERGNGLEELCKMDVHGFSHIMEEGKEYPCIFVMPQCPWESFWVAEIQNIYQFINKVMENFPVDDKKVYLVGLSMGGYGTWYTAQRYPKMFAAIAPICGGGMVWNAGVLDMPIWAFHGTDDPTVNPNETLNMVRKIRMIRPDQEVKLTMFDNVGHGSWVPACQEPLLEWLLMHSR